MCFDGSDGATAAIVHAGALLAPRPAVVLTVWEPIELWVPYDPASVIDAGIAAVTSKKQELEEIAREIASETAARGLELARVAGFEAESKITRGKHWCAICEVADEL